MSQRPVIITPFGDAKISTAQSVFGSASALFNGVDSYLSMPGSVPGSIGTSDYTVECWLRVPVLKRGDIFTAFDGAASGSPGILFRLEANGQLRFRSGLTSENLAQTVLRVDANSWTHVAAVRNNGVLNIFINGVLDTNTANSTSNLTTFTTGSIATLFLTTPGTFFDGNIDEFRISNVARYTANFTPQTQPFLNDANTLLLLHMDGTNNSTVFVDDNISGDQFYIDPGYIDERYYVYIADAQAAPTVSSALSADFDVIRQDVFGEAELVTEFTAAVTATRIKQSTVELTVSAQQQSTGERTRSTLVSAAADASTATSVSVIRSTPVSMSATTTQQATISHIQGADLFAFSESQIGIAIDRLRDNDITADSVFTPELDYIRLRDVDIDTDVAAIFATAAQRSRNTTADIEAAFSTSESLVRIRNTAAALAATAALQLDIDKLTGYNSFMSSESASTATVVRIQSSSVELDSESASTATATRIQKVTGDLATVTAATADVDRLTGTVSAMLAFDSAVSLTVTKITGYTAELSAASQQTVEPVYLASPLIDFGSAFDSEVSARISVDPGADLDTVTAVTASLTGVQRFTANLVTTTTVTLLGGRRQDVTTIRNAGLNFTRPAQLSVDDRGPFLRYATSNFNNINSMLISAWITRDTQGTLLDADLDTLSSKNTVSITRINANTSSLRYTPRTLAEQVVPGVTWQFNWTPNQLWHHLLLYINVERTGNDRYQLYVNNVRIPITNIVNNSPIMGSGTNFPFQIVGNGFNLGAATSPGTQPFFGDFISSVLNSTTTTPGLGQFWWRIGLGNQIDDPEFRRIFYPGQFVDLGENGTANGALLTPDYYFRFGTPTDIVNRGTRATTSNTWRFAQFNAIRDGQRHYLLNLLTVTDEQRHPAAVPGILAKATIDRAIGIGVTTFVTNISAATALTATLGGPQRGTAELETTSTLSTDADRLIGDVSAVLSSEFQQTALATDFTKATAAFATEFQQTAVIGFNALFASSLNTEFSLAVEATSDIQVTADLESTAEVSALIGRRQQFNIDIDSALAFDIDITRTRDDEIFAELQASLELEITKITGDSAAELGSEFTVTVDYTRIDKVTVELFTAFTVEEQSTRLRRVSTNMDTVYELDTLAGVLYENTVDLTASAAALTLSRILAIKLAQTLEVARETRSLRITPEPRILEVEQSRRRLLVLPEPRVLEIEPNTNEYRI